MEAWGRILSWIGKKLSQRTRESEFLIDASNNAPIAPKRGDAFNPDRPRRKQDEDRLGFRTVAQQLAKSIIEQSPSDGYVISIEGKWGCGKTSLINFLVEELEATPNNRPEVVRFEPWIVGDKNGMLSELINDLADVCDRIAKTPDADKRRAVSAAAKLARNFKSYASKLGRSTAPFAQVMSAFGVPFAALVGSTLEGMANSADAIDLSTPITQMKQELVKALLDLDRKIVVVVDDLDRLEPSEAAEVLRLIRAVADFPNIIYLLSYDGDILSENISNALEIDDGAAFLKKMVQVSFKVPRPEAFDLRRWFEDECLALYSAVSKDADPSKIQERLSEVCNIEGGILTTPRDIVRALNAIKLCWPPVASLVDFPDMVWLQLHRMDNHQLYTWIEEYLIDYAAVVDGANLPESEKQKMAEKLLDQMTSEIALSSKSVWRFAQLIPGIKQSFEKNTKDLLFDTSDEKARGNAVNHKRLASPQHYRYYFALSRPSGALDDQTLLGFLSKAEKGDVISSSLPLVEEKRPQGGTMMSALIDRLLHLADDGIAPSVASATLRALAEHMDKVAMAEGRGHWGRFWGWSSARLLVKKLLGRLNSDQRRNALREMFTVGSALGWLMCEILRTETFAHGRYGDKPRSEDEWILTEDELDEVVRLFLDRMNTDSRRQIVDTPEVLSFMFGWKQLGDEYGVTRWVNEEIETDTGFLRLLYACRGWHSSSNRGIYFPLLRRDLSQFLDYDAALARLEAIRDDPSTSMSSKTLAVELLGAAALGEED